MQSPGAGRDLVQQGQDTSHIDAYVKRLDRWGGCRSYYSLRLRKWRPPNFHHIPIFTGSRDLSDLPKGSIDIKQ